VYASTNLSTWLPIFTNPPIAGTLDYLDGSSTTISVRFYRIGEQ
jgi:hypothetical protein